jgi:hypothetical protein
MDTRALSVKPCRQHLISVLVNLLTLRVDEHGDGMLEFNGFFQIIRAGDIREAVINL